MEGVRMWSEYKTHTTKPLVVVDVDLVVDPALLLAEQSIILQILAPSGRYSISTNVLRPKKEKREREQQQQQQQQTERVYAINNS
jgi:hypothetical protein